MINVYKRAVIDVSEDQWIMLYNEENKNILIEPQKCSGSHTCANNLVVADTKEELDQYILNNQLYYSM
jgi:hypothetical protein